MIDESGAYVLLRANCCWSGQQLSPRALCMLFLCAATAPPPLLGACCVGFRPERVGHVTPHPFWICGAAVPRDAYMGGRSGDRCADGPLFPACRRDRSHMWRAFGASLL